MKKTRERLRMETAQIPEGRKNWKWIYRINNIGASKALDISESKIYINLNINCQVPVYQYFI